jgi:TolB protein
MILVLLPALLQTVSPCADYRSLIAQNLVRPVRMEIWVMDADGSQQRQLTNLGDADFADWVEHP